MIPGDSMKMVHHMLLREPYGARARKEAALQGARLGCWVGGEDEGGVRVEGFWVKECMLIIRQTE